MITFTITTCKRLECFMKTMDSFMKHCTDNCNISRFIIFDDSSPQEERLAMRRLYPYMEMICHDGKKHAKSLNLIRANVFTEYVIMFEDDWECTEDFKIADLLNITDDYLKLKTNCMIEQTFKSVGDKQVLLGHFNIDKLDNYFSPRYTNWIDSKPNLRKYLGKMKLEPDQFTTHWPGFSLNPCIVKTDIIKKIPFDEEEDPSFMELSYGIQHVLAKTKIEGIDMGIDHIGDDVSAYTLNDEHRWWDKMDKKLPTLVSAFIDIDRENRDISHYIDSLKRIIKLPNPKMIFIDEAYKDKFVDIPENTEITYITRKNITTCMGHTFNQIGDIIDKDYWINQADWIKDSVLTNRYYIPLTFYKHILLNQVAKLNPFDTNEFYWIDSGIHSSFTNIKTMEIENLDHDTLFMTTFPYHSDQEMHGLNMNYINSIIDTPYAGRVLRASFFGGKPYVIGTTLEILMETINKCISDGFIGTEEAIYTVMVHNMPELFGVYHMETGDVSEYFNS